MGQPTGLRCRPLGCSAPPVPDPLPGLSQPCLLLLLSPVIPRLLVCFLPSLIWPSAAACPPAPLPLGPYHLLGRLSSRSPSLAHHFHPKAHLYMKKETIRTPSRERLPTKASTSRVEKWSAGESPNCSKRDLG